MQPGGRVYHFEPDLYREVFSIPMGLGYWTFSKTMMIIHIRTGLHPSLQVHSRLPLLPSLRENYFLLIKRMEALA